MPRSDEFHWLDDDEQKAWLSLIGVIMQLPAALDAQLRRDAGLSHFEYQVLAALSMSDDRTMRMTELAAFAQSSLSRLSHTCKRLEAQGWLRRRPDPSDGRITLGILTDAGHDKVVDSAPGHVRAVREIVFDPLTKAQVKQLAEITRRINDSAVRPAPDARETQR